ncbi:MAG: TIGR01777 family oxidoreductase [Acidobacteriota bacterium]
MKILVTGASGMVGSALTGGLRRDGHRVVRLVRPPGPVGPDAVSWDPAARAVDLDRLDDLDAVVHLAGENIGSGRWTARKKQRIRASRVEGTRLLCVALARLRHPPPVLVAASAVGFYGDRGDVVLDETHPAGSGFLASVCADWEAAAEPLRACGARVIHLRFGVILDTGGGALARMLPPFRLGLGGRIGNGRQFMSWIALDDAVTVITKALAEPEWSGPINAVSPSPVTNAEFSRTLARVLSRPAMLPMPAIVARLAFGEMADALLLVSHRVRPARLEAAGHLFRHPRLDEALRHLLG